MELSTNNNPVERIGDTGAETQFSITSNAQAFEILSAGIYTDPIAAVIRELSCNAYDAQVEAGKDDEPFIVRLPNKLSPSFSVIDNGIGLSDADLRGLYSSYFQSTKTGTNKQIGAFGLGSKSPFSYSKSFEVISRFDGEKRTYSIFINEDGVPTMSELSNIDTDECNGIEVRLAIREEDHHTFVSTTREVLRYFPVRPTIKGNSTFEWPEHSDTTTVTDTYTVDHQDNGLVAIQGNVPYHVNVYQIEDKMSEACMRFVTRHGIALRFDIGMLDVAANREEVRYEERTKQNIADAVQVTFDDYLVQMDKQLSDLTKTGSTWEIFTTLKDKFGSRSNLQALVGREFKFTSELANKWMKNDELAVDTNWKYHNLNGYVRGEVRAVRSSHVMQRFTKDDGTHKLTVVPHIGTQVVLQDVTTRGSMRMNTKLQASWSQTGINKLIAIAPVTDKVLASAGVTATEAQRKAELKAILKQMGNPPIETLSEWTEDVEPEKCARVGGHTFKTFIRHTRFTTKSGSKPVLEVVSKPEDGGIYIEIDSYRNIIVDEQQYKISASDFTNMITPVLNIINLSKGTNYKLTDVFGLTKKVVKHVSTDSDWTPIAELYADAIQEQQDIIEYYKRISVTDTLGLTDSIHRSGFIGVIDGLPAKSTFRTMMEPVIKLSHQAHKLARHKDYPIDRRDFVDYLVSFESYFNVERPEVNTDSYFDNQDLEKYKMLRHINFSYSIEADDAADYIQMVESK